MTKIDPRSLRTKELIKEATYTLLHDGMPIHQLSVQKVTKQASLNRTTFYLHYIDIYDLIDALVQEKSDELSAKIHPLIETKEIQNESQLIQLLEFLREERENLVLLFQAEKLESLLHSLFVQLITVRRQNSKRLSKNALIDVNIKAASLVGIIMWWFKNGTLIEPTRLAEQINAMFKRPMS